MDELTTYEIYLILLGYFVDQGDDAVIIKTLLTELYRRASSLAGDNTNVKQESDGKMQMVIINIPKYIYDTIIACDGYIADCDNVQVGNAIKNGTPLDVIRADVKKGKTFYAAWDEKLSLKKIYKKLKAASSKTDAVNHPNHYKIGDIECIDVMLATQGVDAVINFCVCNSFKYIYRHVNKNGLEDIRKAKWYLNKALELVDSRKDKCGTSK